MPSFAPLDPLLHSQLRLAIISLLIGVQEAEFTYIKEKTEASAGNLSVQINKLKDAGYLEVQKTFKHNYPLTTCKITRKGVEAFEAYVVAIKSYINAKPKYA
ncbi:winged helix-turn-helix domain-containing protein [Tunicatimonas pelagia]|uniref:winged helix-turn-helix domain-containing protein n=1 Tax=Tunicatimonas pelagia TaxID=931531 RepID=UPI0026658BB0|nr:transcriptional regulator [Tunicatimonas pelagia]WKN45947.1 transcriptional regulator [Tunicatimonas pelagia]